MYSEGLSAFASTPIFIGFFFNLNHPICEFIYLFIYRKCSWQVNFIWSRFLGHWIRNCLALKESQLDFFFFWFLLGVPVCLSTEITARYRFWRSGFRVGLSGLLPGTICSSTVSFFFPLNYPRRFFYIILSQLLFMASSTIRASIIRRTHGRDFVRPSTNGDRVIPPKTEQKNCVIYSFFSALFPNFANP